MSDSSHVGVINEKAKPQEKGEDQILDFSGSGAAVRCVAWSVLGNEVIKLGNLKKLSRAFQGRGGRIIRFLGAAVVEMWVRGHVI